MKKTRILLTACIVALGMAGFSSCQKTDDPKKDDSKTDEKVDPKPGDDDTKKAKYTLMIYGCGGGNLDYKFTYFDEILDALNTTKENVRVTYMFSTSSNEKKWRDSYPFEKSTTYRYELNSETDVEHLEKYKFADASKVKLYSAATLSEYIKWAAQTAPAENYVLMFQDHGGGFTVNKETLTKGVLYDDNQVDGEGDSIPLSSLSTAEGLKQCGVKIKAIFYDACLMGSLEVLNEVAPYCDYVFAGAHVTRANKNIVPCLVQALATDGDFEKIALQHKSIYEEKFAPIYKDKHENCDLVCWRTAKLGAINEQVKLLAAFLKNNYKGEGIETIDGCTRSVYLFEKGRPYIDLLNYAGMLSGTFTESTELDNLYKNLEKAIKDAVVYNISLNNLHLADNPDTGKEGEAVFTGEQFSVSICSIAQSDWRYKYIDSNYKLSAFHKATLWGDWLNVNNMSVTYKGATNPCNDSSWEDFYIIDDDDDDDEE